MHVLFLRCRLQHLVTQNAGVQLQNSYAQKSARIRWLKPVASDHAVADGVPIAVGAKCKRTVITKSDEALGENTISIEGD